MFREYFKPYLAALLISCALYLVSCVLPATQDWRSTNLGAGGDEHYVIEDGWRCLVVGWMFVPNAIEKGSFGMLAWLANPVALIGAILLLFRRPTGATALGAASIVLGALYVFVPPGSPDHPDVPQVGAVLWVCSFIALTVAALIRRSGTVRADGGSM